MSDSEQEKSIGWVVACVMLLIAYSGWAFAAAGYAHSVEGWRSGGVEGAKERGETDRIASPRGRAALGDFMANSVRQVPNVAAVLSFNFRHRTWLPVTVIVLEGLALLGAYHVKRVERSLAAQPKRKKRPVSTPRLRG